MCHKVINIRFNCLSIRFVEARRTRLYRERDVNACKERDSRHIVTKFEGYRCALGENSRKALGGEMYVLEQLRPIKKMMKREMAQKEDR